MVITVNIYYQSINGNAKKFAEEMISSGIVNEIRSENGNIRYDYFFPMDDNETPPYPVHSLLQFLFRKYCNTSDRSQTPADGFDISVLFHGVDHTLVPLALADHAGKPKRHTISRVNTCLAIKFW